MTSTDKDDCPWCPKGDFSKLLGKKTREWKKKMRSAPPTAREAEPEMECPPSNDELGRGTWTLLHTMSVAYPEEPKESMRQDMENFLLSFSKLYPCSWCCSHMQKYMKANPPELASRQSLALWFCNFHNDVNKRTRKPQFDCSKYFERWRDGCGFGETGTKK